MTEQVSVVLRGKLLLVRALCPARQRQKQVKVYDRTSQRSFAGESLLVRALLPKHTGSAE